MFKVRLLRPLMLSACGLLAAAPAFAAPALSITPKGSASYLLGGTALENAATVDLQISYDSSSLSAPSVAGGSLAANGFTAANATAPGTLALSIVGNGPMTGSGPLATITFQRSANAGGGITAVTGRIIAADGKITTVSLAPAQQTIQQPDPAGAATSHKSDGSGDGPPSDSANDPKQTLKTDPGSTAGPVVLGGSVTLPSDPFAKAEGTKEQSAQPEHHERNTEEHREELAETKEPPSRAEEPAAQESATKTERTTVKVLQSALERFRLFRGEATAQALISLLRQAQDAPLTQEPAVAIADGKGTVKIVVRLPGDKAPNFAFNAARAVSVATTEGGWQLVAQPEKDALQAGVTVLAGSAVAELPLTVAPAADVDLDRSGQVTEADFTLFLEERGKAGAPRFDLNGDGRRDYVDDYIFAANYVSAREQQEKEGPRKQGPAGKTSVAAQQK